MKRIPPISVRLHCVVSRVDHNFSDLNVIMARSRDWDELQHVWIEWHRKTGQKIKELYVQLVDLSNYAAQLNSKFFINIRFTTILTKEDEIVKKNTAIANYNS